MNEPRSRVLSTYRLQLHAGFTFDDAREALPYLAGLGVSHLYLSPITQAAPGSTHGYDVTDPTQLNTELGGTEAYERLIAEQRAHGLGQIVDIVPNHMGIGPNSGNSYWEDVLRHGPDSPYAAVFDVEWDTPPRGRVVLPILGATLDDVIAHGDIEVDRDADALVLYGNPLPLRPGSLEEWGDGTDLRDLVALQHYRLEYWRAGQERVDYRRFFAIDDLIGVRAEDPEVFDLLHRLPLALVERGAVDGLRIDHVDGLRDPAAYLAKLQARLDEAGHPGAYTVVEKILEADEPLPDWACDGTTGYDAMNEFTRVLVAASAVESFEAIDRNATGRETSYEEVAAEGRAHVVRDLLGGQFARQAHRLFEASRPPGVSEPEFTDALLDLLAHVEVYRTYHRLDELDPRALAVIGEAADALLRRSPEATPSPAIEAARRVLATPPDGEAREVVLSLQQLMPAVQAKGIEDRALFRFRRLLALNEVGGDPAAFGESVEEFHQRMADRAASWPRRMLATATHDHKLGEDVRARLAALSEVPELWGETVARAFAVFDRLQAESTDVASVHPSDLYLLLQAIVGASPEGMTQGRSDDDAFADRLVAYVVKALREADERTSWVGGDEGYEARVASLARRALDDDGLREALAPVMRLVVPAGAINGLAQTLLKLAGPGVPDTYQGNELWDLSLVDPDNRRAVDFDLRRRLLAEVDNVGPGELLDAWRDARIKLRLTSAVLRTRREHHALFLDGSYEPLTAVGARAEHVLSYARTSGDDIAVAVAPRFTSALNAPDGRFWAPDWAMTALDLTQYEVDGWREVVTGRSIAGSSLEEILGPFPVALLLGRRVR
ncbi:MAG: malto-oligosyltrehalose synthase [Dehalococcoidia bacterium]|nr:malto-oligosyltrehalose synthase [Dehalococcoidia bacterium]